MAKQMINEQNFKQAKTSQLTKHLWYDIINTYTTTTLIKKGNNYEQQRKNQ